MAQPREYNRFAIVPIYADSTGCESVPQNALFVGSQSAVMERILDSHARRTALTIINDAEHAKGTLQPIREREAAVSAREDAVARAEAQMLADAIHRLDASADGFTKRMDSLEAERAKDPDDDLLPLPPGTEDQTPAHEPEDQNPAEPA